MSDPEAYEVYAVRYATRSERRRQESFVTADPHDGPMPIDFYVWALVNANRTLVVDTGFDRAEAERRGKPITRLPREGLERIGVDTRTVGDVIVTHLHFDHAGTLDDFPRATFHMQEAEMAYATGRHMTEPFFAGAYTADMVCTMVQRVFEGRVAFCDGDREIAPGVSVHRLGGHTMGMQCVRVLTGRGWVVLASDGSHFYENIERREPFPIVHDVADMLRGFDTITALADTPKHIVPGHDPLVMDRYPAPSPEHDGIVVRLDVAPTRR